MDTYFCPCRMLVLCLFLCAIVIGSTKPANSALVKISNEAGFPVELFWKDTFNAPFTNLVPQLALPLRKLATNSINSYDTHVFVIRSAPKSGKLNISAEFTKGPRDETVTVTYDIDNNILVLKQKTQFDVVMEGLVGSLAACSGNISPSSCLTEAAETEIGRMQESMAEIAAYRDVLSDRLRNYTCRDPTMENSVAIHEQKIWTMDNFITASECDILMENGLPKLERATIAGDDGNDEISDFRKAQQASYAVNMTDHSDDPLKALYKRVLYTVNEAMQYALHEDGQEELVTIQYNVGDEYRPHCDGACGGEQHIPGGRVATAILYCQVPEVGGSTSFTNAGVFIKPVKGMATFFSYMGLDRKMDTGYTEHSGCPIVEGNKWITTAWLRHGVTKDRPSSMLDPEGIELADIVDELLVTQETEPLKVVETAIDHEL